MNRFTSENPSERTRGGLMSESVAMMTGSVEDRAIASAARSGTTSQRFLVVTSRTMSTTWKLAAMPSRGATLVGSTRMYLAASGTPMNRPMSWNGSVVADRMPRSAVLRPSSCS
jgi:hypothetical protein